MKDVYLVIRGVLNYARIVGKAAPHRGLPKYDKGPLWSMDISPDEKSLNVLKENGLTTGGKHGTGKLRKANPADKNRVGNDDYIHLSILENRPDGTKNNPPTIKTVNGIPWDNKLIGNGSVADVKVKVVDYGTDSEKGVYIQAVRVLKLVPYDIDDFSELSPDDEYFASGEGVTGEAPEPAPVGDADLDDDVPY